jgi:hypothetical protein
MSPDDRTPWDGWTPGDGHGDSMIEDRIRAVFEEPIVPLSPPPGTWERIQTDATRRRRARRLLTAGSAAAVLALFAGGVAALAGPGGDSGPTPTPAPPATAATTPAPSPSVDASRGPERPTGRGTSGALLLPEGGPVPKGFVAYSVTSAARGLVYALGTAPCETSPCTSMVRSADGGRTWVGVPAPKAELSADLTGAQGIDVVAARTVTDVRFATPMDGWAFGGALWQTHDGAVTWEQVPGVEGRVLDLATDGTDVWALTTTCTELPCDSSIQVLHARAGDDEFTKQDVPLATTSLDARLTSGNGTMALAVGGEDSQLYLARPDGTWAKAVTPCAPPGVEYVGRLLAVAPPAEGRGTLLAFCGEGAAGSLHVVTRRSTDGGRTWAGQSDDVTVPNGTFSGTAVTADVVLLAAGSPDLGGALRLSRDGGRTYATPDVDAPKTGWRWVGAAGGGRVLALPLAGTGSIYLSTDSGASFVAHPIR